MDKTSQDESYNNNQLQDIVLMYQPILRTLMWREMKDSEGELKMVKIWSLFMQVHVFIYKAKKNSSLPLLKRALKFCLPWASLGLLTLNA